jgi:hypothetical protein
MKIICSTWTLAARQSGMIPMVQCRVSLFQLDGENIPEQYIELKIISTQEAGP